MKLTSLTISGPDDNVDIKSLYEISKEFPFIEWGILRSYKTKPRYPSDEWIREFLNAVNPPKLVPRIHRPSVSFHLCGQLCADVLNGKEINLNGSSRVQINTMGIINFENTKSINLQNLKRFNQKKILQIPNGDYDIVKEIENHNFSDISFLIDPSGGQGIEITKFTTTKRPFGLAGGLNEHNIVDKIKQWKKIHKSRSIWIDLESGVRTNDKFDLDKVVRIANLIKPHIDD
ncbi:MAG: hypothetical protein WC284_16595 [Candidimonas sp.]